MTKPSMQRDQQDGEVRRILLFVRTANRLRDLTMKHPLRVTLDMHLAIVQPADPLHFVMKGMDLVESTDRTIVENLAVRLRPFIMKNEHCYFPNIVTVLSNHVRVAHGPTCDQLVAKWEATLRKRTAPITRGSTVSGIVPGFIGKTTSEGYMKLMVEGVMLTGEEVMGLLLYGELVHIDRKKERKLIRIREAMPAGFEAAVIAVTAALTQLIDVGRIYAEGFVKQLPPETIERIEATT